MQILNSKIAQVIFLLILGLSFFMMIPTRVFLDFSFISLILLAFINLLRINSSPSLLLKEVNFYFTFYFCTRVLFIIFIFFHLVSTPDSRPKIVSALPFFLNQSLALIGIFAFLLLVYWQIVSKGLVRYAEIVARFFLDALPGQQVGIDLERREGLFNAKEASRKRVELVSRSVELGSLDASLRLTGGNVALIVAATLFYFLARLLNPATSDLDSSTFILLLVESSAFGILLTFDAIVFVLPFSLAMGAVSRKQKEVSSDYLSSVSIYGLRVLLLATIIFYGLSLLYAENMPWEAMTFALPILVYFSYLVEKNNHPSESVFYTYSHESGVNRLKSINEVSADNIFARVGLPLDILRQYEIDLPLKDEFILRLSKQIIGEMRVPKVIVFFINAKAINIVSIENDAGTRSEFVLPDKLIMLDVHISSMKAVFKNARTCIEDVFPYQTWVPREEFEKSKKFEMPDIWSPVSLIEILSSVINHELRCKLTLTYRISDILDDLHEYNLEHSSGIALQQAAHEIGFARILDLSRSCFKFTHYNPDIIELIDVLTNSSDDLDSLTSLRSYLSQFISQRAHLVSGKDSRIRVFSVSDQTSDLIAEDFESLHVNQDFNRSHNVSHLQILQKKIEEVSHVVSTRGQGPLVVLVPDFESDWLDALITGCREFSGKVIFLENSVLSNINSYIPLSRM